MKPAIAYKSARVDLGSRHNGRVTVRRVYRRPDGTFFIVDNGRYVNVELFDPAKSAHVNFVMAAHRMAR